VAILPQLCHERKFPTAYDPNPRLLWTNLQELVNITLRLWAQERRYVCSVQEDMEAAHTYGERAIEVEAWKRPSVWRMVSLSWYLKSNSVCHAQ
jgi:hypothetical protein